MMLRMWLVGVCLLVQVARSQGDEDAKAAKATLERAITALGGAKALDKHPAWTGKSKGEIAFNEQTSPASNEWTVQGLESARWATEVTINQNTAKILLVLGGDKAWISGGGQPGSPLNKDQARAFRQGMTGLRLAETLIPLTGKEYALSALGELKVNDKPTVGIQVKRKGLPTLDLFFDKKSHEPVKAEMRIVEQGEQEAVYSAYFADYKKFDGRLHFTRLTIKRDDKTVVKMERSEIKGLDKQPEETFRKP